MTARTERHPAAAPDAKRHPAAAPDGLAGEGRKRIPAEGTA
jgi:hypothetical protein